MVKVYIDESGNYGLDFEIKGVLCTKLVAGAHNYFRALGGIPLLL